MQSQKRLFKKGLIIVGFLFLSISVAFAQRPDRIKVKPTDGKLSADVRSEAYYYPEFVEGEVAFRNGKVTAGVLNYNMLTGEIEFVNNKKDTLALANMFDVHFASFGPDLFYYDGESKSLLRLLQDYDNTKLLVKERYELTNIKNVGAFGMESSTSAPTSSSRNQIVRDTQNTLKQNESLIYSARSSYYFADKNQYMPASKSSVLKMFPKSRSELKKYIKEHKINFNNKEDVSQLLQYAADL